MIVSFRNKGTKDVYDSVGSPAERRALPQNLRRKVQLLFEWMESAVEIRDLRFPQGNRPEKLKGDRQGQHSIRINEQYRICFRWTKNGPADVEITDYH